VAVHETSGATLLNSSQLHNLSHPAEIPQKPTDVFILEKLRSMAPAPPGNQANASSPPSQDQEVPPKNPVSVQMEDFVIDILEGKREGFLLGSDKHPEGTSGLSDCTEVPSSSDLVSKVAPNGASLVRNLSPSVGETSQDVLQTEQKFIGSQKRPPKAVTPTKDSPDRQLKILLAEDNPINQKVAIRQLQKHGHIVTIVGDGKLALETVQSNHDAFDLVLMDVQVRIHVTPWQIYELHGLHLTQLLNAIA
jgi:CheY-like chemotaxis protein